jgi:putative ABC transport system permease protein
MSHLTIRVIQRTREIGVLGAIGATPGTIARHVWFEALLIGVLSWFVALLFAAPVSYVLETVTGSIFLKNPLDFYMSPGAAGIWLGLVVVLASISSLSPALRAARLPVREALSHV